MSNINFALPPSGVRREVLRCLQAKLVALVRSSPGVGKSDILRSLADEYNLKLYDFRLAQADVTDLNGLPFRTADGRAAFLPFEDFPLEGDPLPLDDDGNEMDGWLLFFDELTSAPKQLQAAGYKVVLERMIGNRPLHDRVMLVAAGNLDSDKAVTHRMSTALQSRLVHLELRVDHAEWREWAVRAGIDNRILGFLEFKPDYLHQFDPDHQDKTFACPRTWEFASKLVNRRTIDETDTPILAGTISQGIAMEFVQFAKIYAELPKVSDIIKDPDKAAIPVEPSTKYAMATHLATHFNKQNAKELVTYLSRYPVEFRVICLRLVHLRDESMMRHAAIVQMFQSLINYM